MSMPWRRFSELCLVVGLCIAAESQTRPAIAAEPPKQPFLRSDPIRIVKDSDGRPTALEVPVFPESVLADLKARPDGDDLLAQMFSVHVVDEAAKADQPAVLGACVVEGNFVRFTPRYPLRRGMKYRVTFRHVGAKAKDRPILFAVISIPEETEQKRAEVARVYPSPAALPESQLRFYIHFSEPMSRGEAYEHIQLLNKDGRPIDRAFLELGEELWDASGRRLTLLIDPGRIKQGLKPREDLGPVLEAGQSYALVIGADWPDAAGRPLVNEFRKSFKVTGPVTSAIDPQEWKIQAPRVGSTAALIVRFPRSLDRALMERTLAVVDANGESVPGQVIIGSEERRWEYLPEKVWEPGSYQLVVDTVLEDLSGNQIGRPFEVDQTNPIESKIVPEKVRLPFTVAKVPTAAAAK